MFKGWNPKNLNKEPLQPCLVDGWMGRQTEPCPGRLGPMCLGSGLPHLRRHMVCLLDLNCQTNSDDLNAPEMMDGQGLGCSAGLPYLIPIVQYRYQHCLFPTFFTLLWAPDCLNFQHASPRTTTRLCTWLTIGEHLPGPARKRHGGRVAGADSGLWLFQARMRAVLIPGWRQICRQICTTAALD